MSRHDRFTHRDTKAVNLDDERDVDDFPRGNPADTIAATADPRATLFYLLNRTRPSFHDEAACRGSGVDFTAAGKTERARAFELCGRCPVREACLAWALDIGDDVAILGGTDPAARRRMKRQATEATA